MRDKLTHKTWTSPEKQLLHEHLDAILAESGKGIKTSTPTIRQLADVLSRTESSIHNKARIMAVAQGKLTTKSKQLAKEAGVASPVEIKLPVAPVETDFFEENDAVLRAIYSVVEYDQFITICNTLKNK
jgi:hypothetical protein